MLYSLNNTSLMPIKEDGFKNEKELQIICEKNLKQILGLDFIATEFSVADLRLDSVAYDEQVNAFVIIEYKNTKNGSVIDQGYTYLSAMLNHKADFVLKYSQVTNKICSINDIDWTQSKVIFISPSFTKYQIKSINFKDLPIELWKIKKFSNDTIFIEEIRSVESNAEIKEIAPTLENEIQTVKEETKVYSEDEIINLGNDNIKELYYHLREFILDLDENISLKTNKQYIGFYINRHCLFSIKVQKNSLLLWINSKFNDIDDPKGIIKDVTSIGHHGNGDCEIKIQNDNNIGYIQDLLKRFYTTEI